MRLKIISTDGTAMGTRIVDADTGAQLDGVVAVEWRVSAEGPRRAEATLTMRNVPVELVADEVKVQ